MCVCLCIDPVHPNFSNLGWIDEYVGKMSLTVWLLGLTDSGITSAQLYYSYFIAYYLLLKVTIMYLFLRPFGAIGYMNANKYVSCSWSCWPTFAKFQLCTKTRQTCFACCTVAYSSLAYTFAQHSTVLPTVADLRIWHICCRLLFNIWWVMNNGLPNVKCRCRNELITNDTVLIHRLRLAIGFRINNK